MANLEQAASLSMSTASTSSLSSLLHAYTSSMAPPLTHQLSSTSTYVATPPATRAVYAQEPSYPMERMSSPPCLSRRGSAYSMSSDSSEDLQDEDEEFRLAPINTAKQYGLRAPPPARSTHGHRYPGEVQRESHLAFSAKAGKPKRDSYGPRSPSGDSRSRQSLSPNSSAPTVTSHTRRSMLVNSAFGAKSASRNSGLSLKASMSFHNIRNLLSGRNSVTEDDMMDTNMTSRRVSTANGEHLVILQ